MNGHGALAVSGADVFCYFDIGQLGRMDRDGKHAKPVVRRTDFKGENAAGSLFELHRLATDDEALYVLAGNVNGVGYDLYRVPRGGAPKKLAHALQSLGSSGPWAGVAVGAAHVYWADTGAGEIRRVDKQARCAPEVLAQGRSLPDQLFVTKTGLLWLDKGSGAVMRLPLAPR